jgi:TatA/E family protein of Tat protein translocase
MPELAVIVVLALIVLGPRRLPEVARALGKGLAEFRRVTGEVNRELESARSMIEAEAREHEALRRKAERERTQQAAAAASEAVQQAKSGQDRVAAGDPAHGADPELAAVPPPANTPAEVSPSIAAQPDSPAASRKA